MPVFTHLAQATPYNDAQIASLAKFPLITIEKCEENVIAFPPRDGGDCSDASACGRATRA